MAQNKPQTNADPNLHTATIDAVHRVVITILAEAMLSLWRREVEEKRQGNPLGFSPTESGDAEPVEGPIAPKGDPGSCQR